MTWGARFLGRLLSYGSSWHYAISQTCASMLIRLVQEQYIEENNFIVEEGAKGLPKSNKEWYNFKLKGEKGLPKSNKEWYSFKLLSRISSLSSLEEKHLE